MIKVKKKQFIIEMFQIILLIEKIELIQINRPIQIILKDLPSQNETVDVIEINHSDQTPNHLNHLNQR